jgi:hypothetical protein
MVQRQIVLLEFCFTKNYATIQQEVFFIYEMKEVATAPSFEETLRVQISL